MAKQKVKVDEDPGTDVTKFLDDLVSEYGDLGINISKGDSIKCEFVSTGIYSMNYMLTNDFDKGLPEGQVIEIHGPSSTGKSLFCKTMIKEFLRSDPKAFVLIDDCENAYVEYSTEVKNPDDEILSRVIRVTSACVEDHFNLMFFGGTVSVVTVNPETGARVIKTVNVKVPLYNKVHDVMGATKVMVILDSLAALSTRNELEGDLGTRSMDKALLVNRSFRELNSVMHKGGLTYLYTNRVIANIQTSKFDFGPKTTTTGGSGGVYTASIRISLEEAGKITPNKESREVIGVKTRVEAVKNRFAPSFRKTHLNILFSKGISKWSGLVELLKDLGIIVDSPGGWYKVVESDIKFQSKDIEAKWEEIKKVIYKSSIVLRDRGIDSITKSADDSNVEVDNAGK